MAIDTQRINDNYHQVLERIEKAASSAGRSGSDVRLVTVTKGHPIEAVQALIEAGARDFGENRVEEAQPKISTISGEISLKWHMIGHLQSRKAGPAAQSFNLIHSVDRIKIANRLNSAAAERDESLPVLLQYNVSGEEAKSGWAAQDETRWESLLADVGNILALPHLKVTGLMTMAPYSLDPEDARPVFVKLRRLRDFLGHNFPSVDWKTLSMGMSADFEVAVQEGATLVRVGTAVLGPRNYT